MASHLMEDAEEDFTDLPPLEEKETKQPKKEKKPEKDGGPTMADFVDKTIAVDAEGWEDVLGSGRLRRRVVKVGEGEEMPARGSRVVVRVEERVAGRVVGEEQEVEFNVGEAEVLQCLDLVVPLMCLGEVSEVRLSTKPAEAHG